MTFHRHENDTVLRMTLHQGGDHGALRVKPIILSEMDLIEYCGLYYSSELKTFYEIKLEDKSLIASHNRHDDIKITAVNINRLASNTWFFNPIIVERRDDDSISGLLIGSGRMRNVLFEKLEDGDFKKY